MTKHTPHHFSRERETHLEEIGDYMTSPVIAIDSESSVKQAAQLMHSKQIGSLLVKKNAEFVGMVAESNLSHKIVAEGLDPETTKVSKVMTHDLLMMERSKNVEEANIFMARNKIRHLCVTENGKIVGVLSVKDLVSFYAHPRLRTW